MSKNTVVLSNNLEQYNQINMIEDPVEKARIKQAKREKDLKQMLMVKKMKPNKIKKNYSSKPKQDNLLEE